MSSDVRIVSTAVKHLFQTGIDGATILKSIVHLIGSAPIGKGEEDETG